MSYDIDMIRKVATVVAWAVLLFIVYATLSPIQLRPHVAGAGLERFGAFACAGLLFGIAYPRHLLSVLLLVVGAAAGLEVMQHLTPDRHGHVSDAVVKIAGGVIGIGVSLAVNRISDKHPG